MTLGAATGTIGAVGTIEAQDISALSQFLFVEVRDCCAEFSVVVGHHGDERKDDSDSIPEAEEIEGPVGLVGDRDLGLSAHICRWYPAMKCDGGKRSAIEIAPHCCACERKIEDDKFATGKIGDELDAVGRLAIDSSDEIDCLVIWLCSNEAAVTSERPCHEVPDDYLLGGKSPRRIKANERTVA